MSRFDCCDDDYDYSNPWPRICYAGALASATRGKKGQAFFKELLAALDAMPVKKLITSELQCPDGSCALGVFGKSRGLDMSKFEPDDYYMISRRLKVNEKIIDNVAWMNDEMYGRQTPEERFVKMREWVMSKIKKD